MTEVSTPAPTPAPRRFGCLQVAILMLAVILLTVLATLWVVRTYVFPAAIEPVALNVEERQTLEAKLRQLQGVQPDGRAEQVPERDRRPIVDLESRGKPLVPELYREDASARVLFFSQRELNGLIARNPDLADRMALHLSRDKVSATWLLDLPPDFPFMPGQTVRLDAGLRLAHEQGRLVVVLEGVSVMGVPLPSAWLGGLKGADLVALYGTEEGFWKAFAGGVKDLRVEQGRLRVELAE